MARFRSKLSLVLGLCLALALTKTAHTAAVDERPPVICHQGSCYPRVFRPTTEFQEVLEGQEIPGGLHVQMDFETHKKFAKLMDPSDIQEKAVTDSVLVVDTDTPGTFQHQVGNNQLINMPPAIDLQQTDSEADFAALEENGRMNLQTAFDSIPELHQNHQENKPATPAVNPIPAAYKSDHQIYKELIETLKTNQNNVKITEALEQLTDLASDMDFGLRLSDGEGLRTLVNHVRCTSKDQIVCEDQRRVRSVAALVIGTSLQNHAKAQESAYKQNLHKVLLTQLEVETDVQVLRRLMFAYSNLVRGSQHPGLIQDDDVARLANIYNKSTDPQFRRKCVYLMSDFADPDMQFIPANNDTTTEDAINNNSGAEAAPAVAREDVDAVASVNVGPWCESLQKKNKTSQEGEDQDDWVVIDRAIELLRASYPDTCIVTGSRSKDEL
ncbi:nucleotide exchange factor sil1 [Linnemannia zychae]|nr:nucleotide exchange factor sil1 [Linnemannia zychae]